MIFARFSDGREGWEAYLGQYGASGTLYHTETLRKGNGHSIRTKFKKILGTGLRSQRSALSLYLLRKGQLMFHKIPRNVGPQSSS